MTVSVLFARTGSTLRRKQLTICLYFEQSTFCRHEYGIHGLLTIVGSSSRKVVFTMSDKETKTTFSMNRRNAVKAAGIAGAAAVAGGSLRASAQDATPEASAVAAPTVYEPQGPQVEKLLFWTRSSPDSSLNEWQALEAVTQR